MWSAGSNLAILAALLLLACAPAPIAPPPTTAPKPTGAATPGQLGPASTEAKTAPLSTRAGAPARRIEGSGYRDGDTLNIVVPFSPGGGFDLQARVLQPFLEKAIRDVTGASVRVVVQNMPGAQQRVGIEHVNRSPADGKTILYTLAKTAVAHQVLGGTSFDVTKMTTIASLSGDNASVGVLKSLQLPERTLLGLAARSQQKPILIGHPGSEADLKLLQAFLRERGIPLNLDIVAFEGSSPLGSAVLRGDLEAAENGTTAMMTFVRDNPEQMEPLVTLGCERSSAAPNLRTIVEQGVPSAEIICGAVGGNNRLVAGPPAIPAPTADALSESLRAAFDDPEHAAAMLKLEFVVGYRDAAEARRELSDIVKLYTQYKAELQ